MSQNTALIAISTMYQFQDLEIRHLIVILLFRFLIQDDEKVKHWDRGGVPLWQEPHCLPQQGQDRDVRVGGRIQLLDKISHEYFGGLIGFCLNLNSWILRQVEDPDPQSQYFVVTVPTPTCEEDSTSVKTPDTALTLEAKTEDVKKVWIREIKRKTDRRKRSQTRLTTGSFSFRRDVQNDWK